MITVTVLYPAGDGSTFDMDYYRTTHRDIVERVLKPERFRIDQGIDEQPFMAIGHLEYESMDAMQGGLGSPEAAEAQADIANFTNVTPQIQISQSID